MSKLSYMADEQRERKELAEMNTGKICDCGHGENLHVDKIEQCLDFDCDCGEFEKVVNCEWCQDDPSFTSWDELLGEVPCTCVMMDRADRDNDSRLMTILDK